MASACRLAGRVKRGTPRSVASRMKKAHPARSISIGRRADGRVKPEAKEPVGGLADEIRLGGDRQ
jgi:hypothetical protein